MRSNQQGAARPGLIIVIVVAAAIAIAAVTFMIITSLAGPGAGPEPSGSPRPSSSAPATEPTPTQSPSASPSEDPASALAILSLTPADQSSSGCTDTVGTAPVTFRWTTTGAAAIYFGIETDNAKESPYASGLDANGSIDADYPCGFGSQIFTLTVEGADGTLVSRSVTLLN